MICRDATPVRSFARPQRGQVPNMGHVPGSSPLRIELPEHPAQAGRLRRLIAETCTPCSAESVQLAQLLGTELFTNAITHGSGPITVVADLDDSVLHVEVTDEGTGRPRLVESPGTSLGGRGLLLVEQIASAWGVRPRPEGRGKTVWFRLPVSL